MKKLASIVRKDFSCPSCGHSSFIVDELQRNLFLTDNYGEIKDSKELIYKAIGMCTNCKKVFKMIRTPDKFNPVSELMYTIINNTDVIIEDECDYYIDNPMQLNKEDMNES